MAAVAPSWILRGIALAEQGTAPGLADLRGAWSDAAVSAIVAALALAAARAGRFAAAVVVGVWVLAAYANYEHLTALGASLNLAHADQILDPTFLMGSALSPSRPWTLAALLGTAVVLALILPPGARKARPAVVALLMGVFGLAVLALWPVRDATASWRQASFVTSNLVGRGRPGLEPAEPATRRADLAGTPRVPFPAGRPNILLLTLESISGAYVESVAVAHGRVPPVNMPRLDALARRGLSYRTFVVQQQQTNRGQYALLCGDYPRLISATPRMSEAAVDGVPLDCLPAALRSEGYATAYLQSAPLRYMLKDRFMPRAGFDRVHGDEWFRQAYARNEWGVDDLAFLEQSLALVDELDRAGGPWFLSLMTSGTHHPLKVPEIDPTGPLGHLARVPAGFPRAVAYLDEAVGRFVSELNGRGILKNTVVVLVSDESFGFRDAPDDTTQLLGKAWGVLVVLYPGVEAAAVDEPFAQMDLAASMLDWIGSPAADRFRGRSIFREYVTPREIAFANTYLRRVAMMDRAGGLLVCEEPLDRCAAYTRPEPGFFAATRTPRAVTLEEVEHLRRTARESLASPSRGAATYRLVGSEPIPVDGSRGRRIQPIFGGQFLFLPSGARAEVRLELVLQGREGSVTVGHDLVSEGDVKHYYRTFELSVGQRAVVRYTFDVATALEHVESRTWVARARGSGLALRFSEARLSLIPFDQVEGETEPGPSGLVEREFRIVGPS